MMYSYTSLLLIIVCFANGVLSNSDLTRCRITEESCLQSLANNLKFILFSPKPDLGIPSSDPLFVDKIENKQNDFVYKFSNTTIIGFSQCLISNVKLNPELTKFEYDMDCKTLTMTGKYEFSGQLFTLPVEGSGDYKLMSENYFLNFKSDLKTTKTSDGKTHLSFGKFKLKVIPRNPLKFAFQNLYNGQKDKSDAFHNFLHENWKEITESIQDDIWYPCLSIVVNNVNQFLTFVPLDNFLLL